MRSLRNRVCDPPCYYIKGEKGEPGCNNNNNQKFTTITFNRFLEPVPDHNQFPINNNKFNWEGANFIANPNYNLQGSSQFDKTTIMHPLSQCNSNNEYTLWYYLQNYFQDVSIFNFLQYLSLNSSETNNNVIPNNPFSITNPHRYSDTSPYQKSNCIWTADRDGKITGYSVYYTGFNYDWVFEKKYGSSLPFAAPFVAVGTQDNNNSLSWTFSGQSVLQGAYENQYIDPSYNGGTPTNPESNIQDFNCPLIKNSCSNNNTAQKGNCLTFKKGDYIMAGFSPSVAGSIYDEFTPYTHEKPQNPKSSVFWGVLRWPSGEHSITIFIEYND